MPSRLNDWLNDGVTEMEKVVPTLREYASDVDGASERVGDIDPVMDDVSVTDALGETVQKKLADCDDDTLMDQYEESLCINDGLKDGEPVPDLLTGVLRETRGLPEDDCDAAGDADPDVLRHDDADWLGETVPEWLAVTRDDALVERHEEPLRLGDRLDDGEPVPDTLL